ncbi:MAG: glycerophosphodiester phosphodiesterase [Alphaproteobacteria bacterium]|nr:glycerophosphodiester phosphodiesterase [Alphaproteobacteria bacterium]
MQATHRTDWITDRPIAHRGYHDMNKSVWENTATAFDRAIHSGFAIECDLQVSSDGVPVVFHDYVLKRLCGVEAEVKDVTAANLSKMRVGETADRILTLEQMLSQIGGSTGLIIELKPQESQRQPSFAKAVVETLAHYPGPAALMSFDESLVRALVNLNTDRAIGLTAHGKKDHQIRNNERALDIPIDFVSFHVPDLPCPFVETARGRGLPVITWTVRDAESVDLTSKYADQMTFEGFDPNDLQR